MNQIQTKSIIYIFLVLIFSSCNTLYLANDEYETSTNSELESLEKIAIPFDIINKWKLEAIRAYADESFMKIISNDKTPTLYINSDSSVGGYDGCNRYGCKIVFVSNDNFYFTNSFVTSRGCHPSVYWHDLFYKSKSYVNNYTIQNGKLLLKKDSHVLMIFSRIFNQ